MGKDLLSSLAVVIGEIQFLESCWAGRVFVPCPLLAGGPSAFLAMEQPARGRVSLTQILCHRRQKARLPANLLYANHGSNPRYFCNIPSVELSYWVLATPEEWEPDKDWRTWRQETLGDHLRNLTSTDVCAHLTKSQSEGNKDQ